MTERRTTITRNWRPAGAPARRHDDFVAAVTTPATPSPAPAAFEVRVVERRSIARRLENWGMWANDAPTRGGGSDCMTGVICANMRRHAVGELGPAAAVNDRIDVVDAQRINAALARIAEAHRWVLHWTYIVCVKPRAVAGACGFPSSEYGERLTAAQAAIETAAGPLQCLSESY